ncbi:tRNA (adenosine(37)-N6)-threonylcarbamoyltransferase complex dimerization subunit type 1 TsaB [Acaryochloris sp. CCMEE 5410]|uniref:tRNA (adenosine(37)-N6)-threonylcarbamoyltransferase complex dimerization subunit type 1 TsaB n=1 Tax=Acaryochloris sp. CCMEE 5410 TaxID=310037 RepID=UPI000248413C|nr:tRNA (adenosine(37)-N6)-threonylcarbamoyltransferase complex dimerization subunit type 1 TsaB [Acaryochloris sp. CCMEE 5410]
MHVLGLDTTSSALTLGISNFAQINRYQTWDLGRDISIHLHHYLKDFLAPLSWSDLGWLVVAQGPGSFTGTRIGVVTARTLAQQLNIPLYGVSTLTAQAYAYASSLSKVNEDELIAVEYPGQRGSVYGSLFTWDASTQALSIYKTLQYVELEVWQHLLSTEKIYHHLYPDTVDPQGICQAMISLAHQRWQAGQQPTWQKILPYYGSLAASPPSR